MKILIVGDSGSIFIKQYIENVLLGLPDTQIVLIQENPSPQYLDFYKENDIKVEPLVFSKNKWVFKMPVVRSILGVKIWCREIKKKYRSFDLIHIHGLNRSRGNIGLALKKISKKTVISIWGDEVFRKDAKTCKPNRKYYDIADTITVSTTAMLKKFTSLYGNTYTDKVVMNKFAIGLFDKIDTTMLHFTRKELCEHFGIASFNKTLVFVGHNGREAQRHLELTRALSALSADDRKKIVLVYTMTYGVKSDEYLSELKALADSLGCEYVILQSFLNEDDCAKLRCICDVLLHAQLTDAFSASIQESLYAGSIVLNGSWLKYTEIPNYSQSYIEYDEISQIPDILHDVLENFEEYKTKFGCNKEILKNISSVEVTTKLWRKNLQL